MNNIIFSQYPDVLDTKDVQELLKISRKTVYCLIRNGKLPYRKIGSRYRLTKESVLKFLNASD